MQLTVPCEAKPNLNCNTISEPALQQIKIFLWNLKENIQYEEH